MVCETSQDYSRNCYDKLHYTDKKNCFLLKEAATDSIILMNGKEVVASESFEDTSESNVIVREIISVATMNMQCETKKVSYLTT